MSGLRQMGQRAITLAESGRHAEAVLLWERMHRQQPEHAGISLALGSALLAAGRVNDAAHWLAITAQRHPADKGVALLTGRALMQQRQRKLAIGAFYHALSLDPGCVETHAHLANALFWDRQSAAALAHAERACRGDLNELTLSTYLCVLHDLGHAEQALSVVNRAIDNGALSRETLLMYRAAAFQALGRLAEGLADAREVVSLAPGNDIARHHYAAALLAQGQLTAEAWAHYEGRIGLLEMKHWPALHRRWTGQDVRGATVLVHAEQGLGDTLQFIRYIPMLAALGARVIVAVQPSLVQLLQGTPGAAEVMAAGCLPPFDYYCPLLSLPGQFGTTLETIPPPLPYARTFPPTRGDGRLQVGIVWAGGDAFVDDRKRSLDPTLLAPLAEIPGVDWHSLQFNATDLPLPGMHNAMEGVRDFVDSAERVARLDLVIAVDTAVAHLAATMGKPVWLLHRHNGCWRWLLDREDSPWYPSVRLFRQSIPNDWTSVVARLRDSLDALAAQRQQAMSVAA